MSETYKLELYASGPFAGCESTELIDLAEYGYTDEGWDSIPKGEQGNLLEAWAEENFWSQGYEYNAEIRRG
jgi:hypothetical protein